MFKLILTTVLLISTSSWAVTDGPMRKSIDTFVKTAQQERSASQKIQMLKDFKQALYNRIDSFDLTEQELKKELVAGDKNEAFRSLNEFEGYIDLIPTDKFKTEDCKRIKNEIETSASKEAGVVPEAVDALKILSSLCQY